MLSLVVALYVAAAPSHVVRYRKIVMKAMSAHLRALEQLAKDKDAFVKHAPRHAEALVDMSDALADLFPANSGPDSTQTDALPTVWKDPKKFAEAVELMRRQATKVKADLGTATFRADIEAAGDACSSCHESFRKGQ